MVQPRTSGVWTNTRRESVAQRSTNKTSSPTTTSSAAYDKIGQVYANTHEHHEHSQPHRGCERARAAYQTGDFCYQTCREILEEANLPTRPMRAMCDQSATERTQAYVTYGMFTHGGSKRNHHGQQKSRATSSATSTASPSTTWATKRHGPQFRSPRM